MIEENYKTFFPGNNLYHISLAMIIDRKIFHENMLLFNHFDLRGQGVIFGFQSKITQTKPRQFRLGKLIESQTKQIGRHCF
jgi:hypothetical protein